MDLVYGVRHGKGRMRGGGTGVIDESTAYQTTLRPQLNRASHADLDIAENTPLPCTAPCRHPAIALFFHHWFSTFLPSLRLIPVFFFFPFPFLVYDSFSFLRATCAQSCVCAVRVIRQYDVLHRYAKIARYLPSQHRESNSRHMCSHRTTLLEFHKLLF